MNLKLLIISTLAFLGPATSSVAQELKIEALAVGNLSDGYLWTATFQRVDGITCVWLRVEDNEFVEAIYDNTSASCRAEPPAEPQARFMFTNNTGVRLNFEGVDFDVVNNTARQLSGAWNHTSFNSGFDVENVVFRPL